MEWERLPETEEGLKRRSPSQRLQKEPPAFSSGTLISDFQHPEQQDSKFNSTISAYFILKYVYF